MKRALGIVLAVAVATFVISAVYADQGEVKGRYRIHMMNGNVVEGDVTQLPDGSYEVKTKQGIVVKVRKGDVKVMLPVEDKTQPGKAPVLADPGGKPFPLRRAIGDDEIDEILAGVKAEIDEALTGVSVDDLDAPLPVNPEAVNEMVRQAGGPEKAKVLEKPHFVMVYTSTAESAQKLGARLESVWRWNAKMVRQLKLKAERPEYKLEIYYFGTYQEFNSHALSQGSALPPGVAGYYQPDTNRSHFFDLWYMPEFEGVKKELEEGKRLPAQRRRFLHNYINGWVEFQTQDTIQHEAGHHIHFNTGVFVGRGVQGGTAQTWLVEGLTMQLEVPPSATGEGGAGLGELNDHKLDEFRRMYPKWTAAGLKSFILNNGEWYQGYNYPRGWAVVYYLWMKKRDAFGEYIRRVHARPTGEEITLTEMEKEFEDCFGRLDDKWIESFYKFMDSLHVRQSRLPPKL